MPVSDSTYNVKEVTLDCEFPTTAVKQCLI